MPRDDSGRDFDEFISALKTAGVSPQKLAAFVQGIIGVDSAVVQGSNFPGFEYLERVSTAAFRALMAHAQIVNSSWSDIRGGAFPFSAALQSWSRIVENYSGVIETALRGPSPIARPVWLVVPYRKKAGQSPDFTVRIDDVLEKDGALEATDFETLGKREEDTSAVYARPPHGVGSIVEINLNAAAIEQLSDDSHHVSIICRRGAGPVPPLVVLVLRVIAASDSRSASIPAGKAAGWSGPRRRSAAQPKRSGPRAARAV